MSKKMICIYLNDHVAAMVSEHAVAERSSNSNPEPPLGPLLAEAGDQVQRDLALARSLLEHFDAPQDRVKQGVAWLAEKVGRLKPNDRLTTYSELSRVLELEGLALAARARATLWDNLAAIADTDIGLPALPYQQHAAAATDLAARLTEQCRLAMAAVVAAD